MYQEIKYQQEGPVVTITFNRPEVHNCIGPKTHLELIDAWGKFRADTSAKVAILTGAGDRSFCSGGDLKSGDALKPQTKKDMAEFIRGGRPGILGPSAWTDIYKPIIAAVNGSAYAGGLEWACFADIRIAEEHSSFGVTCRRWGIGLADGGTQRLPRIIGMGRAMELIITGRVINADEAERYGLVNEIVPKGCSLDRAKELADAICNLPQEAIKTDKEAVIRGFGQTLTEGLRIEAECMSRLFKKDEMYQGQQRFVERTHPDLQASQKNLTVGIVGERC